MKRKPKWDLIISYILLIVIIAIMGILKPKTISLYFLGVKCDMVLPLIFMAVGQTIVLLSGGIDLSVGGVMSLCTSFLAVGVTDIITASLLMMLMGIAVGFLNGFLISKFKIQPFVATLGTWTVLGGCALWILKTDGGFIPEEFRAIFISRIAGVPVSLLYIFAVLLIWLFVRKTPFGYAIYSVGSNEKAAFYNGINVNKIKIMAYAISGFFAVLSGLAYCAITGTGSPTVGDSNILISVAAAVIGGTSLEGGRGGVGGTIVGAFILKLISDVLVFAGVTSYWTPLFQGILLIMSVAISSLSVILKQKRRLGYD